MPKRRAIGQGARPNTRWPYKWQAGASKRFRNQFAMRFPRGSDMSKALYGEDWKHASDIQKNARLMTRFKGPGDYKSAWKKYRKYVPRGIGAAAGYALGYGAKAGYGVGARASKFIGWGDYSANQIVDYNGPMNPQQNIHHMSVTSGNLSGDIIYSNSEFVTNVFATLSGSGASGFEIQRFDINPGVARTFPFLSQIAQNFELYEFQGLLFQYKPTSGEYGSNNSNAIGKVVMCTNYDPDAGNYPNTIVMENYDYACSTKPSEGCVHGVECKPSQRATNSLYTRIGESSKDKVFTDIGTFQIATEGIPSAAAGTILVGELWVTYTVKLSRAKLEQLTGNSILHAGYSLPVGTDFGAKASSIIQDADNTVSTVTTAPVGKEIRFSDVSATRMKVEFGSGYQGLRIEFLTHSTSTIASGFRLSADTPVNCTVTQNLGATQGTTQQSSCHVITFDSSFTGVASFNLETAVAPSGSQVTSFGISIVDPQFSLGIL